MWSALAGAAQLGSVALVNVGYPYVYDALIAMGYGLILPFVAVMHVRHASVRASGAILATISGTATVAIGLGGAVSVDLRPAALFILGMWWWTSGKLWVETALMPRPLGVATAALGALALAGGLVAAFGVVPAVYIAGVPQIDAWTPLHVALGVWLIALAPALYARSSALPSG